MSRGLVMVDNTVARRSLGIHPGDRAAWGRDPADQAADEVPRG